MFAGVQLQMVVAGMLTKPLPKSKANGPLAEATDAKEKQKLNENGSRSINEKEEYGHEIQGNDHKSESVRQEENNAFIILWKLSNCMYVFCPRRN